MIWLYTSAYAVLVVTSNACSSTDQTAQSYGNLFVFILAGILIKNMINSFYLFLNLDNRKNLDYRDPDINRKVGDWAGFTFINTKSMDANDCPKWIAEGVHSHWLASCTYMIPDSKQACECTLFGVKLILNVLATNSHSDW